MKNYKVRTVFSFIKPAIVKKGLCWEHMFFQIAKMAEKFKIGAMSDWCTTRDQYNKQIIRVFCNICIIRKNFTAVRKPRGFEWKAAGYLSVSLCTSESFQTRQKISRLFVAATGRLSMRRHLFLLFHIGEWQRKVWGFFNYRQKITEFWKFHRSKEH